MSNVEVVAGDQDEFPGRVSNHDMLTFHDARCGENEESEESEESSSEDDNDDSEAVTVNLDNGCTLDAQLRFEEKSVDLALVNPLVPEKRSSQRTFEPTCERCNKPKHDNYLSIVECLHVHWVQLSVPPARRLSVEGAERMRVLSERVQVHPHRRESRERFYALRSAVFQVFVFGRTSAASVHELQSLFGAELGASLYDADACYPTGIPISSLEMDEFMAYGSVYVRLTHAISLYIWHGKKYVLKVML